MSHLLDPAVLAKLEPVSLRAQRIAEGLWGGIHPSRLKGASVEFSEHKQYSPGDELRHLDWKVYAKSDRLFIKQFEDETNIQAYAVMDASGSMGYCSREMAPAASVGAVPERGTIAPGPVSKLAYASLLAAGLCYLLEGQQDAVGIVAGGGAPDIFQPPRRGRKQLAQVLQAIESLRPSGPSNLAALCGPILESHERKSLVAIFTDLLGATEDDWTALRQLRARGNEIVLFHVLDPFEVHFPFQGWSDFDGLEGEAPVQADPVAQRPQYLSRFRAFLEDCRGRCVSREIAYERALTDEPVDRPLLSYLLSRRSASR